MQTPRKMSLDKKYLVELRIVEPFFKSNSTASLNPYSPALSVSSLPLSRRFVRRKRQQDVARHGAESRIAGIDEDHPSHDDRARAIERSTAALDAVHGLVIAGSVEIPKKSAVLGCEGPQVTVERTREDCARNRRHRR